MKLVLLHGPAEVASREKLFLIKEKFGVQNTQTFDSSVPMPALMGSLMTLSLIPEERLIILENPDVLPLETLSDIDGLLLVFWFSKELSEKNIFLKFVKEKKGEIYFFPEGKEISVFPFLDMLGNKDKKAYLEMEKLKKAGFDTQYLITMILYLLRSLTVSKKSAPSFVIEKTKRQRKNFSDIPSLYEFVLETDFKIKSGLLDNNQAQFMLVQKFIF